MLINTLRLSTTITGIRTRPRSRIFATITMFRMQIENNFQNIRSKQNPDNSRSQRQVFGRDKPVFRTTILKFYVETLFIGK